MRALLTLRQDRLRLGGLADDAEFVRTYEGLSGRGFPEALRDLGELRPLVVSKLQVANPRFLNP